MVDNLGATITVKKKIYSAMVESLENIYKHQDLIHGNTNYQPRFELFYNEKSYSLYASNTLLQSKIEDLNSRLEQVNSLDKEGLKKLYKQTILSGNLSPKGGAGLGIINIAKVSENKIKYQFDEINDDFSFFTINVLIIN